MTENYEQYERNLKRIIHRNVKSSTNGKIEIHVFYRNRKLKNLFIKNNTNKPELESNLIYKYKCDKMPCTEVETCYIGLTTVTVRERFKQHRSIKKHFSDVHNEHVTGSQMMRNVSVIARCPHKQDLHILEALLFKEINPSINRQTDDFNRTLKIF